MCILGNTPLHSRMCWYFGMYVCIVCVCFVFVVYVSVWYCVCIVCMLYTYVVVVCLIKLYVWCGVVWQCHGVLFSVDHVLFVSKSSILYCATAFGRGWHTHTFVSKFLLHVTHC